MSSSKAKPQSTPRETVVELTLRDFFASHAMQARVSGYRLLNVDLRDLQCIAETSYAIADAMLEARNA